jgi:hypothetical protein
MTVYYPSFYRAVHRAYNGVGWACRGTEEPYNAEEHACYDLAGNLRVELHAAGVRLNIDGYQQPKPRAEEDDFFPRTSYSEG